MRFLFSLLSRVFPAQTVPQAVAQNFPASVEVSTTTESTTTQESQMSKLSAYFAVIKFAAGAVLTAEVSAPAGASGADKLDIAKAALESAYPELGIADVAFETVWPMVKPFIDVLVIKLKSSAAAA